MPLRHYDVAIAGGGFSGTTLAYALARTLPSHARIALIERGTLGAGVAYDAPAGLLMNGPAREMSAIEDWPNDLVEFARVHPDTLVERRVFGAYMRNVLDRARDAHPGLDIVAADVLDVADESGTYRIRSSAGDFFAACAVLATGTALPSRTALPSQGERVFQNPWTTPYARLSGEVAIVGSGLTALDAVAQLASNEAIDRIHVISSTGRFPLEERPELRAAPIAELDLDASSPQTLLRTLRRAARTTPYDWRSVVDAIRRSSPTMWGAWSTRERKQFLRHAASVWALHRYRAPAATLAIADGLAASGRLRMVAGKVQSVHAENRLGLQIKGAGHVFVYAAINATGPSYTEAFETQPLLRALRSRGALAPDTLGLGFDIDGSLHARGSFERLFAIGPATRSQWYESTAVPEIRRQADLLAAILRERAFAVAGAA